MKKIIFTALILTLGIFGCGGENSENKEANFANTEGIKPYNVGEKFKLKSVFGNEIEIERVQNGFKIVGSDKILMFGLVFGKPLGVFIFSYVAIRLRLCQLPSGSNFKQFLGLGFLTGIGASMSLFIDAVAFKDSANFYYADKLAILIASFASAIIGFKILYSSGRN